MAKRYHIFLDINPIHRIKYEIPLRVRKNLVKKDLLNVIQVCRFSDELGLQFGESHVIPYLNNAPIFLFLPQGLM